MKVLLLLLVTTTVNAQVAVEQTARHYQEVSQVMGYKCPTGYFFNPPTKLCYPEATKEETTTDKIEKVTSRELPTKRLNADAITVNIYNDAKGRQKIDMPPLNVEGQLGVKRRRSLDKAAVLSSVEKSLEGDWSEEEKDSELTDLVVE